MLNWVRWAFGAAPQQLFVDLLAADLADPKHAAINLFQDVIQHMDVILDGFLAGAAQVDFFFFWRGGLHPLEELFPLFRYTPFYPLSFSDFHHYLTIYWLFTNHDMFQIASPC